MSHSSFNFLRNHQSLPLFSCHYYIRVRVPPYCINTYYSRLHKKHYHLSSTKLYIIVNIIYLSLTIRDARHVSLSYSIIMLVFGDQSIQVVCPFQNQACLFYCGLITPASIFVLIFVLHCIYFSVNSLYTLIVIMIIVTVVTIIVRIVCTILYIAGLLYGTPSVQVKT